MRKKNTEKKSIISKEEIILWSVCISAFVDNYAIAMCFGLAWINARCPQNPLCHSPSSPGQGRGNMRVEVRTGRDHSPVTVMDKTD